MRDRVESLLGQFLDGFRIDFLRASITFRRLFIALNNLVQTLFGDVVSALARSPCANSALWLNRSAAERFRPAQRFESPSSSGESVRTCSPTGGRAIKLEAEKVHVGSREIPAAPA